jgi:hypothetical protein
MIGDDEALAYTRPIKAAEWKRRRPRFPQVLRDHEGAYDVRGTVPPWWEIEARIEWMLSVRVGEKPRESLSEGERDSRRL